MSSANFAKLAKANPMCVHTSLRQFRVADSKSALAPVRWHSMSTDRVSSIDCPKRTELQLLAGTAVPEMTGPRGGSLSLRVWRLQRLAPRPPALCSAIGEGCRTSMVSDSGACPRWVVREPINKLVVAEVAISILICLVEELLHTFFIEWHI